MEKTVQKDVQMGMASCITSKNFESIFMAVFFSQIFSLYMVNII